ncbi:hypothetical protein AVEN_163611-1 [Araneus ventricosus]|uniref:Uncharacterized protein n=1 Tax=Araneus ventricosus TaxID=182803 RepID=A0A4Y2U2T8_ARAVE|nr:hypothetical protein AVEN_163611-1 [Araneus ventricosus]
MVPRQSALLGQQFLVEPTNSYARHQLPEAFLVTIVNTQKVSDGTSGTTAWSGAELRKANLYIRACRVDGASSNFPSYPIRAEAAYRWPKVSFNFNWEKSFKIYCSQLSNRQGKGGVSNPSPGQPLAGPVPLDKWKRQSTRTQ